MYWTINSGGAGFTASVRDHILHHGLTLSRALRQRLFHPDDVELTACVTELIYDASHFHWLFRARSASTIFSGVPAAGGGERLEAAREVARLLGGMTGASVNYETILSAAKVRVTDMLWQRVDSGHLVCGQHEDCMAADELGRACALRLWEESPLLKLQGHGT